MVVQHVELVYYVFCKSAMCSYKLRIEIFFKEAARCGFIVVVYKFLYVMCLSDNI